MGQFHTEMALFKASGKFITKYGGPAMLIASTVFAGGSSNRFVSGSYNGCKRNHPLFACALEILYFKLLIKRGAFEYTRGGKDELRELLKENSHRSIKSVII